MLKGRFKHLFYRFLLPYGGVILVRLIALTYRLRLVDTHNETAPVRQDGSLIYASWHQRFFPGITFFSSRRPISIMISKSLDGEMVARVVKILGWHPVRGSSSSGGKEALQELKTLAQERYRIGHIVDGPRGPFGKVKAGILRIAQTANLSIVPTITSGENRWEFGSWDRFMVPKPFSRVIIRFGTPIEVPPDLDEDAFEVKRLEVENSMAALYKDTDKIWSDPARISSIF